MDFAELRKLAGITENFDVKEQIDGMMEQITSGLSEDFQFESLQEAQTVLNAFKQRVAKIAIEASNYNDYAREINDDQTGTYFDFRES